MEPLAILIVLFAMIVAFAFGILQIILFFKVWKMTDDVSAIRRMLDEKRSKSDG